MTPTSQDNKTLQEWRETARFWTKHSGTIRTMFAPLTEALIEDAGISEGQTVLDVAGGAGEPSLTIAERVGPAGAVTCTDAVAEMVAAAESEAQRRSLTNLTFQQCVADSLPFESNSFDAVVCRLGVMFFPDPLAALGEMLRVTKPGGSVALAVWHKDELNPFTHIVTDVMSRYVESPPADPDAPGAFRFAEPGKLASVLRNAGASDVGARVLHFQIEAPISPSEFWTMRSETSDTLRAKLAKLPAEEVLGLTQEVQEAGREYFPNNQMSFPAQMIIVSGKKSDSP
ncbi:MAG TPA: methyltransferase domain-containing protein [Pyrinomonadaceae bacterium]|nr:methyltransferase domain-containing protein [Pyrinomonadaceae bacterium]